MTTRERWLQALLFVFVLALGLLSVHSSQTWVCLNAGRWIWRHAALPGPDSLSYMSSHADWRAHDWLADVLLRGVHAAWGPRGLIAFKAVLIAAGFALVLPLARADTLLATGTLALAACGAWPGLTESPSLFDFLLLGVLLRLLDPAREARLPLLARVAALSVLWANLHPAGAWLGAAIVSLQALRRSLGAPAGQKARWAAAAALSFAALWTNPHVGGAWASQLSARPDWSVGPGLNVYGFYLFAGAAAAWICLQEDFFLSVAAMLVAAASLVAPVVGPLYLLAVSPLLASALGHFLDWREANPRRIAGLGLLLCALFLSYVAGVTLPRAPLRGYASREDLSAAVGFLDASGARGRMFNDPASAPYLLWKAAEQRPLFFDPRFGVYEPGVAEAARDWTERWPALAQAYKFDYAVIENRGAGYPCRSIDQDPDWALAYWDDVALVYLRKGGADDGVLRQGGAYRFLRPNHPWEPVDPAALADAGRRRLALAEAERAMRASPGSVLATLVSGYLRAADGDRAGALERLRAALRLRLWKPEHALLVGRILERSAGAKDAVPWYRAAAAQARRADAPQLEAKAYDGLGGALAALGRRSESRRSYRKALRLDPDDPEARDAAR